MGLGGVLNAPRKAASKRCCTSFWLNSSSGRRSGMPTHIALNQRFVVGLSGPFLYLAYVLSTI